MKNNISVTIDQDLLDEIKVSFPDKNRSQVIEEALEFWTKQTKMNRLRKDAEKLKTFFKESKELEDEAIEDGLDGL